MLNKDDSLNHLAVFDSLVHITQNGKWFDTKIDAGLNRLSKSFPIFKKALLVGIPGDDLNYLIDVVAQYPGQFVPIAPFELGHENHLDIYLNELKSRGFKGIKIHPRLLGISLTDERIIEAILSAGQQGLISLLCTIHRSPSVPLRAPISEVLYDICIQARGAKIILLHGGYYDLLATSEMVRSFENVLLDLSATMTRFQNTHLKETIAYLFETFDRRLCIGSDYPEYTIQDVITCVTTKILANKQLSEDKITNIFYGNLHRFIYEH